MRLVGAAVGLIALAPSVLHAQASPAAALRREIQQAVRAYVDAYNQADVGAVAEMYGRQPGVTSAGDGEILRGWDRIREFFDEFIGAEGTYKIALGSVDVTPLGPGYAMALGSYTITGGVPGESAQQRGAMTLVFQKIQGAWKVIHDHTSSEGEEIEEASSVLDEASLVAAMKSDLRNLVTAEEAFFADSVHYTANLGHLRYRPSVGNTVRVTLTVDGWTAVMTNPRTAVRCVIFVGARGIAPAVKEGAPACR